MTSIRTERPLKRRGLSCMTLLVIPMVIISVVLIYMVFAGDADYRALTLNGRETDGTVISTNTDTSRGTSRDETDFFVTYEFFIDGRLYTIEEQVRPEIYYDAINDPSVRVIYAAGDPSSSTIDPDQRTNTAITMLLAICWNAITLPFIGFTIWSSRPKQIHPKEQAES